MTTNELIHSDLGVSETGVGIVYVLANPAMQSCMENRRHKGLGGADAFS